ncbi:hydroxymyristoyl-ACP dehydratase [Massilibacteroides vaginae]|uniref:hydroxymyristoyl-ACP dehydratase n=1 Tax=Massilibacteroides vaginae TaxID=1673718 RepID=UPI000A1CB93A|nr:hydroxymyristoyl-ACP dehydratase [Massilibacteroides vaginae]
MTCFEKALLVKDELLTLIPQRPPMVMVDAFYGIFGEISCSGLTVGEDCLFCSDGQLDECGIIEHIAQSAAARVGYLYRSRNEEVPIGFFGSADQITIHRLPKVGEVLQTIIRIEQEVFDITLISAEVESAGKPVASGKMKIFLKKDK